MNAHSMLNIPRLPARLDVQQTAELLGFMEHDIAILIRARLLKPLGDPVPNAHKYFSSVEIQQLFQNRQWLDKATKTVARYWHGKNSTRRSLLSAA